MIGNNSKLSPGLFLIATPIGNARDLTLRSLDLMHSADVLAAEDTRSLRRLMEIHGVKLGERPLLAYHEHNARSAGPKLLAAMAAGQSVLYASEAGTPLISDPGFDLVRIARDAGHAVTAAPGACAAITALTIAGLPTDRFMFGGFLPNTSAARKKALRDLSEVPGTLVFYESPKRVAKMLRDAAEVLGGARHVAVCRELTKKFEEVIAGTLQTVSDDLEGATLKGEIVVLIDRASEEDAGQQDIEGALFEALKTMSVRDAADLVAMKYAQKRRPVYQMAMRLAQSETD